MGRVKVVQSDMSEKNEMFFSDNTLPNEIPY